jgi:DNA integrity scanning protein DisA with diadenylate cyclase activity
MGKASKAHRAKIAKRNENIKLEKKQMEKKYLQMMEQQLQAFQNKFSGLTESDELNAENIIDVLSNEEVTPTEDQVSELEK